MVSCFDVISVIDKCTCTCTRDSVWIQEISPSFLSSRESLASVSVLKYFCFCSLWMSWYQCSFKYYHYFPKLFKFRRHLWYKHDFWWVISSVVYDYLSFVAPASFILILVLQRSLKHIRIDTVTFEMWHAFPYACVRCLLRSQRWVCKSAVAWTAYRRILKAHQEQLFQSTLVCPSLSSELPLLVNHPRFFCSAFLSYWDLWLLLPYIYKYK